MGKKQQQGHQKKAISYLRVSTGPQQLGIEAQRASIKAYCDAHGIELVGEYADHGISGAAPIDRCHGLLEAIEALKTQGAGLLVSAKRDRLSREVVKAAMVEQLVQRAGARVVSAAGEGDGTDASAQLMRTLVDAFAQYERAVIAQRTKAALAVKKAKGQRTGGVPWGKTGTSGGLLVENKEEVLLIQQCAALKAGGMTLRAIADKLNGEGTTLRGRPLYEMKVHRLLQRAA